ncbi:MAG: hypothetical protein QXP59_08115 [Saccharolobus sp.]
MDGQQEQKEKELQFLVSDIKFFLTSYSKTTIKEDDILKKVQGFDYIKIFAGYILMFIPILFICFSSVITKDIAYLLVLITSGILTGFSAKYFKIRFIYLLFIIAIMLFLGTEYIFAVFSGFVAGLLCYNMYLFKNAYWLKDYRVGVKIDE